MKSTIFATLTWATCAVVPAMAEDVAAKTPVTAAASADSIIEQVSRDVKSKPTSAAQIVKAAILNSQGNGDLVAQIVRAAIIAAPKQIHAIYNMSLAVAPDAARDVNVMIAGMLRGDEVAGEGSVVAYDESGKNPIAGTSRPGNAQPFRMPSDIDVDDPGKLLKFMEGEREVGTGWVNDGRFGHEVKLDNWFYNNTNAFGADPSSYIPVVTLPVDTRLFKFLF